jgi:hypothetical protein
MQSSMEEYFRKFDDINLNISLETDILRTSPHSSIV